MSAAGPAPSTLGVGVSSRRAPELLGGPNAQAVQEIARDLLHVLPGERLRTTTEYARRVGVGQGTIQKAFRTLEALGAIRVIAQGHLGTFLRDREIAVLWRAAGYETIIGVLPLPDWSEVEGLATALYDSFAEVGIAVNLVHSSASKHRLAEVLERRASFATMSQLVAKRALRRHPSLTTLFQGKPGSYYRTDSLVVLSAPRIHRHDQIKRVAVDRSSPNHVEITKREFGSDNVELVEVPYRRAAEAILAGSADAAVWHRTTARLTVDATTLRVLPLRTEYADARWWRDISTAVIVGHEDEHHVRALFEQIVDPTAVADVVAGVVSGTQTPIY